jgi:glycosyltransferase involved in cell wall biosynthesis
MTGAVTVAAATSSISVLMVIGQLQIGGTERHLEAIVGRLNAAPLALAVFSFRAGGPLAASLRQQGVRVFEGSGRGGFTGAAVATLRLLAQLWRERPVIVHFFLPQAYLLGGWASLLAPRATLLMSRRSLNRYQRKYPGSRWLERMLHRRMRLLLANSEAVREELLNEGVGPERVRVVYNGVMAPPIAAAEERDRTRAELAIAADALVFVMVANFIPYKGHIDLLDALALARPHLPEGWRLLLVGGDGQARTATQARIRDHGLSQNVVPLGQRPAIGAILRAADIGVSCSHEEGFSNAILEMMAAGLALVVTDVGGNREAVIDEDSGLLVPSRSPPALAQALRRLAGSGPLRDRLGTRARARVIERFGLDACVERYRAMYLALACPPGAPPATASGPGRP